MSTGESKTRSICQLRRQLLEVEAVFEVGQPVMMRHAPATGSPLRGVVEMVEGLAHDPRYFVRWTSHGRGVAGFYAHGELRPAERDDQGRHFIPVAMF